MASSRLDIQLSLVGGGGFGGFNFGTGLAPGEAGKAGVVKRRCLGLLGVWRVYFMENPIYKWMITRGTPMTMEIPI